MTVYFSTIFNAYHSKPYHFTPDMTILDFPFALLASPLQTFPNTVAQLTHLLQLVVLSKAVPNAARRKALPCPMWDCLA